MRIRTIKPEFFLHFDLVQAEKETGFPLRIAYIGLWCAADRMGRFKWEPERLGIQILPFDGIDFSRVLDALVTRGWIVKYVVNKRTYGCVPSFSKHQFVNNKEKPSDIPEPPQEAILDATATREERDDHATVTEGVKEQEQELLEGRGGDLDANPKTAAAAFDTSEPEPIKTQPITQNTLPSESEPPGMAEIRVKSLSRYLYTLYATKGDIRHSAVSLRALKNPPIHEAELVDRAMSDNPTLTTESLRLLFDFVMSNPHWRKKANDPSEFARHIVQISRDNATKNNIAQEVSNGQ